MDRNEIIKNLIEVEIYKQKLNLEGLVVFTEAATGNFVVTPIIAAKAGAKVIAVTRNSKWGNVEKVKNDTFALAEELEVEDKISITTSKNRVGEADIITNLGWVRPINSELISKMKLGSVISLMYEAWEVRSEDVDFKDAKQQGMFVVENIEGEIFNYCGELAIKLLYEKGITIKGSNINLISEDKFGNIIGKYLCTMGANVYFNEDREVDVTIIADLIGKKIIDTKDLPESEIIVMAGATENEGSLNKMNYTFAYLGPRPVIELHTKGLKEAFRIKNSRIIKICPVTFGKIETCIIPGRWFDNNTGLIVVCSFKKCPYGRTRICEFPLNPEKMMTIGYN